MNPDRQQVKPPTGCLPRSGRLTVSGGLGFVILLSVILVGLAAGLTALGGLIIIADPEHKADAIVVLSGGGTPRLAEAVRLRKDKLANAIILTETGTITEDFGKLSAIERNQLVDMGVTPQDIYITEQHVDNTRDEAHVVHKLMNTQHFKSVIVVTDPYHSLRTRIIFTDEFSQDGLTVYVRPVRGHWYSATTWWTSLNGWEVTLSEYARLLAYVFIQRYSSN
jgi:uncharacterized SAM-binding protein YcdF (DUF218 family)